MRLAPTRDASYNELATRLPWRAARLYWLSRIGVRFEERRTAHLMMHTEVLDAPRLHIGARCLIGRWSLLDARGGLRLGDDVNVSSYCRLLSAGHDAHSPEFAGIEAPVEVQDYAWLGTGVLVLPGVTVGHGAVVAAGSVVTRDLEPMLVHAGVPARPLGPRRASPRYRFGPGADWS